VFKKIRFRHEVHNNLRCKKVYIRHG
jgi:hypothetical protein